MSRERLFNPWRIPCASPSRLLPSPWPSSAVPTPTSTSSTADPRRTDPSSTRRPPRSTRASTLRVTSACRSVLRRRAPTSLGRGHAAGVAASRQHREITTPSQSPQVRTGCARASESNRPRRPRVPPAWFPVWMPLATPWTSSATRTTVS